MILLISITLDLREVMSEYVKFLEEREERLVAELIRVRRDLREAKWANAKKRLVRGFPHIERKRKAALDISHLRLT